jgi:membrane fusion protein (multidrug efflux system)
MMRLSCAALLPATLSVALLLACGGEQEVAEVVPPVIFAPVTPVDLEERLEVTGQLLARDHAEIAAEVAGRITEIVFDEGQRVETGDAILEIDPERRELEVATARAGVEEATAALRDEEREAKRVANLREREIASTVQLERARLELELAKARLEAARARLGVAERALRDATVRAPFPGRVARRHVSRGEFVQMGQSLVELVALEPLEVEFFVAERDSARVRESQPVSVRVDSQPGLTFPATVTVISPTIDPKTRTLRVLARLDPSEGRLRPGLFARADLGVATRENVLMVPEEAVLQRADGAVVYRRLEQDRVARVPVETGLHRDGHVEIVKGLETSDVVVTRGHAGLVDGMRVSPRNPDGSPFQASVALEGEAGRGALP